MERRLYWSPNANQDLIMARGNIHCEEVWTVKFEIKCAVILCFRKGILFSHLLGVQESKTHHLKMCGMLFHHRTDKQFRPKVNLIFGVVGAKFE